MHKSIKTEEIFCIDDAAGKRIYMDDLAVYYSASNTINIEKKLQPVIDRIICIAFVWIGTANYIEA